MFMDTKTIWVGVEDALPYFIHGSKYVEENLINSRLQQQHGIRAERRDITLSERSDPGVEIQFPLSGKMI